MNERAETPRSHTGAPPQGGEPVVAQPEAPPLVEEPPVVGEPAVEEPPVDEPGVDEPPVEEPPVEEPEAAAARYLELAKRTQADFENYRKRMARENAVAADRGAARLAKELLPALDHLELALKAASPETTQQGSPAGTGDVIKGFAMVRDELLAGLGKAGIQAFSPQGEQFDPNQHEAMAQRPADEAEPGTVLEVYQQGYRVNGAVLRPARVVVAQ